MKKQIKTILVSSLTALAFGAISIGTTYALFTSKAETAIEVGSGKIQVSASISDFVTYSAKVDSDGDRIDENGHKYASEETAVNGVFTNGGTAVFANSAFTLERITPGDRITFSVGYSDDSNVDYKYRVSYKVVSQDVSLAKALVTKTNLGGEDEEFTGLLEYTTTWEKASEHPLGTGGIEFDIELPINKGNYYQEKEVEFAFTLEAVQANAYTTNEGEAKILTGIEDLASEPAVAEAGEQVVLEVANGEGEEKDFGVVATLPADLVDAGDKVELLVSDAELDVGTSAAADLSFDITLKVNDEVVSSFDETITIEIYVGEGLHINQVLHGDVEITNYSYDEDTGIITFTTSSFSPFTVRYQMPIIGGAGGMIEEEEIEENE